MYDRLYRQQSESCIYHCDVRTTMELVNDVFSGHIHIVKECITAHKITCISANICKEDYARCQTYPYKIFKKSQQA